MQTSLFSIKTLTFYLFFAPALKPLFLQSPATVSPKGNVHNHLSLHQFSPSQQNTDLTSSLVTHHEFIFYFQSTNHLSSRLSHPVLTKGNAHTPLSSIFPFFVFVFPNSPTQISLLRFHTHQRSKLITESWLSHVSGSNRNVLCSGTF